MFAIHLYILLSKKRMYWKKWNKLNKCIIFYGTIILHYMYHIYIYRIHNYPVAIVLDRCLPVEDNLVLSAAVSGIQHVLISSWECAILQPAVHEGREVWKPVIVKRDDGPSIHVGTHIGDLFQNMYIVVKVLKLHFYCNICNNTFPVYFFEILAWIWILTDVSFLSPITNKFQSLTLK